MADTLVSLVKSAFRFLEDEYGFTLAFADEDGERLFYDGTVLYESGLSAVSIGIDRGIISLPEISRARDAQDRRFKWASYISLSRIREYAITTAEERATLLSHDPGVALEIQRIEHAKDFGLAQFLRSKGGSDRITRRREELDAYAQVLRDYADPLLRGHFSRWLELREYDWGRWLAERIRREREHGKDISVREVEASYEEGLAYLQALRREYGRA